MWRDMRDRRHLESTAGKALPQPFQTLASALLPRSSAPACKVIAAIQRYVDQVGRGRLRLRLACSFLAELSKLVGQAADGRTMMTGGGPRRRPASASAQRIVNRSRCAP